MYKEMTYDNFTVPNLGNHIRAQRLRKDMVGELARKFIESGHASPGNSFAYWHDYLIANNASEGFLEALEALAEELSCEVLPAGDTTFQVIHKGKVDTQLSNNFRLAYMSGLDDLHEAVLKHISLKYFNSLFDTELPEVTLFFTPDDVLEDFTRIIVEVGHIECELECTEEFSGDDDFCMLDYDVIKIALK